MEEQRVQTLATLMYGDHPRSDDSYDMLSDVLQPLSVTTSSDRSIVSDDDEMGDMVMQHDGAEVAPYVPPPPGFLRDEQTGELHSLSDMWIRGHDLYGFHVQVVSSNEAKTLDDVADSAELREEIWKALEEVRGYGWFKTDKSDEWGDPSVQVLARKGIPPVLRRVVWLAASLARLKKKQYPYFYFTNLQLSIRDPEVVRALQGDINAIDADIARSFHNHEWLSSPEGRESLRGVLVAYAMHNPTVGYCQGMIYVVGMLLLGVHFQVRDAFWMLVTLMDVILYPGFYGRDHRGMKVEMGACFDLMKDFCNPPVAFHVEWLARKDKMIPEYVMADWFATLYACSEMPSETTMRIWDVLFTTRRADILFGVAFAIFREADFRILDCTEYEELKRLLKHTISTRFFNPDYLLNLADEELRKFNDFNDALDFARKQNLAIHQGRSPPLRR